MTLTLIDATSDSLTISWTETNGATSYVLQYRPNNSDSQEVDFETLSDKLQTTQARKKNLYDDKGTGFYFRVRAVLNNDNGVASWTTHSDPLRLLSKEDDVRRMAAPRVTLAGANETVIVSWNGVKDATSYELQMRENLGGSEWQTVAASLSGTQVRKKNLSSKNGYQFRLRPVDNTSIHPFSPPSDPVVALGLSDGIKKLFGKLEKGTLLRKVNDPIPLAEALGGREFVLLYASASWCGPCRQFTPSLAKWYQSLGANKTVEVVFVSADRDEKSFQDYFGHMPWLAVNHDEDTREELMAYIGVKGIPQLAVLDGRTGRIIEQNAVGKSLDVSQWRSLLK